MTALAEDVQLRMLQQRRKPMSDFDGHNDVFASVYDQGWAINSPNGILARRETIEPCLPRGGEKAGIGLVGARTRAGLVPRLNNRVCDEASVEC